MQKLFTKEFRPGEKWSGLIGKNKGQCAYERQRQGVGEYHRGQLRLARFNLRSHNKKDDR